MPVHSISCVRWDVVTPNSFRRVSASSESSWRLSYFLSSSLLFGSTVKRTWEAVHPGLDKRRLDKRRAHRRPAARARTWPAGRLDETLTVTSQDEIGHLTTAFNRMVEQLRHKERMRETFGAGVTPRYPLKDSRKA